VQEATGGIAGLIRRARGHDQAAFASLYRFALTPVYRYVSARVDTVDEAEELTQEVFVAALAGISGLRAEDEVGLLAWLFQIARHKQADHLRRRYRQPTAPAEAVDELESADPRPDEAAEAEAERAELREALTRLTPEQREVVVCKYVLGYGNEATALAVGRNVNAVNQLHHRALASLHRLLSREAGAGSGKGIGGGRGREKAR